MENQSAEQLYEQAESLFQTEKRAAIKLYNKAAEVGLTKAMVRMGELYLDGDDIPQSVSSGLYWLKSAVENDRGYKLRERTLAAKKLLELYAGEIKGLEDYQNDEEYIYWVKMCLDAPLYKSQAQYLYGCALYEGLNGLEKDEKTGMEYLEQSAKDCGEAAWKLYQIYRAPEYDKKINEKICDRLLISAAEKKVFQAQLDLLHQLYGQNLLNEEFEKLGVEEQSHILYLTGMLYATGTLFRKSSFEASRYFEDAMKFNHPGAMYQLNLIYIEEKKYKEAESLLIRAAESGYEQAQIDLAQNYDDLDSFPEYRNPEIKVSIGKAIRWYETLMKKGSYGATMRLIAIYGTEKKYKDIDKSVKLDGKLYADLYKRIEEENTIEVVDGKEVDYKAVYCYRLIESINALGYIYSLNPDFVEEELELLYKKLGEAINAYEEKRSNLFKGKFSTETKAIQENGKIYLRECLDWIRRKEEHFEKLMKAKIQSPALQIKLNEGNFNKLRSDISAGRLKQEPAYEVWPYLIEYKNHFQQLKKIIIEDGRILQS